MMGYDETDQTYTLLLENTKLKEALRLADEKLKAYQEEVDESARELYEHHKTVRDALVYWQEQYKQTKDQLDRAERQNKLLHQMEIKASIAADELYKINKIRGDKILGLENENNALLENLQDTRDKSKTLLSDNETLKTHVGVLTEQLTKASEYNEELRLTLKDNTEGINFWHSEYIRVCKEHEDFKQTYLEQVKQLKERNESLCVDWVQQYNLRAKLECKLFEAEILREKAENKLNILPIMVEKFIESED